MTVETSIIIRTYNEERHLPALFDGLAEQTYRDFEAIVVDSGSIDRTRDIAAARGAKLFRIEKHDFTFGYSLNVGIENSSGKFIVMVSAHTKPASPDWLENLIKPLRANDVAMTYGRQLGVAQSKFSEAEDFRRIFGTRSFDVQPPNFFANNANSAVQRSLWERYKFDEKLTGLEDIDFAKYWIENGMRVRYVADAPIYHIHEETWPQVRGRYYREAVAARHIGMLNRRHCPKEIARELQHGIADLVRSLVPGDNPVRHRLSILQRWHEIVSFRFLKAAGTVQGLLMEHPLETREEQEHYFFDRGARAVSIKSAGEAELITTDIPDILPGEALIRVAYTAVCATDLEIFNGNLGYFKDGLASYPIVPGHEFSGHVVNVGQNVKDLVQGAPVVVECIQSCGNCWACKKGNIIGCEERSEVGVFRRDGAYADYIVTPAQFVHTLPDDLDTQRAALAEPTAVILKGLRMVDAALRKATRDNDLVGVVGAGPLGHLCAKVLSARGMKVRAFDKEPARLGFLDETPIEDSSDLVRLHDCQVVVELTGNPDALDQTIRYSPAGATILLLGFPYGERQFSFERIVAYDKSVIGSVGSTRADFDAALKLLPSLDLQPFFNSIFALEDFSDAWAASLKPNTLKAFLKVNEQL